MKTSDRVFTHAPDPALDRLLVEATTPLPGDFTARVMAQVMAQVLATPASAVTRPASRPPRLAQVWRGLRTAALVASGLLGLSQVLAFVLGVWLAGAAA